MVKRSTFSEEREEQRRILAETFPKTGKVRINQLAAYLNIGVSTAWLYIKEGRIKKPMKLGARISVFDAEYGHSLYLHGLPEAGTEHPNETSMGMIRPHLESK